MVSYKDLLFEFLRSHENRKYCLPILQRLLRANVKAKKMGEGEKEKWLTIKIGKTREKLELRVEELYDKMENVCEFIVRKALAEGYNAMVVPFMISVDQAPNFYIFKERPTEEELYWWLYHLLSGVHYGDIVVNIANLPEESRKKFREYLIEEKFLIVGDGKGVNTKEILSRIGAPSLSKVYLNEEFILGLLFLSYFAKFWALQKGMESVEVFKNKLKQLISDDVSLLVFILSREKKRVYIFPRLDSLITRWYDDLLSADMSTLVPKISSFIFSFYIREKEYAKLAAILLNKFLYYFLSGYINGEILCKLIEVKISYELKKGKTYGFRRGSSEFFFSRL